MTTVYRITKSPQLGELVDSTDALEAFARAHGPGRYHAEEHLLEPFEGTKVAARAWGTVIHQPDGRIALKPFFFGDHVPIGRD
jgi:hypothetical protein